MQPPAPHASLACTVAHTPSHSASHGLLWAFSLVVATALSGCAASAVPGVPANLTTAIDAVLPAGDGWRVFRLGAMRHARVPGTSESWPEGTPAVAQWQVLAAPAGPFRPVQAVAGQRGYFHLVDAASARLCLYNEDAALLSTHPLPEAFTPFPAGRAAVFRGADGAFTFVDYGSGEAWQFADRQTTVSGTTRWLPRGKVKLPPGLRDCMQPPGATGLYCRGGDGEAVRFDGALNRISAAREDESGLRAIWDTTTRQWGLEALSNESGEAHILFRHFPASRQWQRGDRPAGSGQFEPSP